MKLNYKVYKRYREDIWAELVKFPRLNAFLALRLVLFSKGLYRKKKEDFSRNILFKKPKYTTAGLVFLNKQKLRVFYFNVKEHQMKKIYLLAQKNKYDLVDSFVGLLESRIDVILYRLNYINHIKEAKEVLRSKVIFVDGIAVTQCNHVLDPGNLIEVSKDYVHKIPIKQCLENDKFFVNYPSYLEVNLTMLLAIFLYRPKVREVFFPFSVDCQLAVQFFKDVT
jgi:small subunit ribosomal protein S4